jgi:hypothetical protein
MNTNLDRNNEISRVEETISMSLYGESGSITRELIEERIKAIPPILNIFLTEDEKLLLIKRIEASIQITMNIGSTLVDSSYRPWVRSEYEHINWYYWDRYKKFLIQNGFSVNVVSKMDIETDSILDLLQNPSDAGAWKRKGLVVGHVQSGKTANYAGVVCKALDAGYRVVIIMAGLLNSLRRQTQGRIDTGIIGLDSSLMLQNIPIIEKLVGVGHFSHVEQLCPVSITTAHADFNKKSANQLQTAINQYAPPLVFVIKKNVSILRNLIDWLENNNIDLSNHPMLLIDDEADHASINTKKENLDPTTTNNHIRELLSLFPKNIYLGYTATPFANIFINPETPEDMLNDLFPENFIKTLEAPSNYFGGNRVFVNGELDSIRIIDDYGDFLPLKHKKEELPNFIPVSLEDAIKAFILVCAIRILRGQESEHNSMLINVSRFTGIQSEIRILIFSYINKLRDAVINYHALNIKDALKSTGMLSIYEVWEKEFSHAEFEWIDVQKVLKKAISRVEVIEVNNSQKAEKDIDYTKRNYPEGRHIIAVGGLSLSRGITLEGLSTTYFLRNSIMYDTLMQMGRWFGYRPGYEDLCRIYMTEEARSWYEHISLATDELRDEFRRMERLKKTPKDFGLCVRNHPESLIVTARNKMRSSKTVVREIDLTGRLIETTRLYKSSTKVTHNLNLMVTLLKQLKSEGTQGKLKDLSHYFWRNVPHKCIIDFVESFQNHPESMQTESGAVKNYVEILANELGIVKWNVIIVNVRERDDENNIKILQDELKIINPSIRRKTSNTGDKTGIVLSQRKLASGNLENIDLEFGEAREIPLLILYILDCRLRDNVKIPVYPNGVVAYGISFPGEKNGRRIKKMATYQVNTTWWKEQYGSEFEDDDDMGDEYE